MKADVTLSNLYWNKGVASFFFREQAYKELERLVDMVGHGDAEMTELEDRIESVYENLDDFEEDCYNASVEELMDILGYEH